MISCPNKNSKAWKSLVKARGEDMAYILWNAYDGDVPEGEYEITKDEIADEILSKLPKVFQIGSSVLNLRREPQDIDFISIGSDQDILDWLDSNNIEYTNTGIDVSFNYKNQNVSIALEEQTKNFLNSIGIQDINQFMEPNRKLVNLTLEYKKVFGRDKDLQDIEEHNQNQNIPSDARFKLETKPVYTLEENPERKQRFIEQIKPNTSISFEYWSQVSKERAKRRNILVTGLNLAEGYITGIEDDVEKKFLINNIIDRTNPLSNKLNNEEIEEFKASLQPGKAISFYDDLSGLIAERTVIVDNFGEDDFVGIDVETDLEVVIPYTSIVQRDTIENELKVSDYVNKIRKIIATQIKYLQPRIKDAADQNLYNTILEAQAQLADYEGVEQLESLVGFLKQIDISIKKIKVLIDNIEKQGGDIPSQLRRIGLLKDFVDGHKDIEKILNPIMELNPNSEMNDVIYNIIANIRATEKYYFERARPKLAKWLYDHMSPELNERLKKHKMDIITVSSLEKFLANPNNDLTWIDTYVVAASNVNDNVTGLFSLALKRLYNMARKMNIMYKTMLMPLFDSFSKKGYKGMVEAYRKMFFYEVVHTANGPIAKRRWVTEFNDYQYYAKLNEYKSRLNSLAKAALNATNPIEAEGYVREQEALKKERQNYINRHNITLNFDEVKEMMEKLQIEDPIQWRDLLNNKFNFKLSTVTEAGVKEQGFKEPKNSLLIDGRYYVYSGGMKILNKELFRNQQYEKLKNDPEAFKMYEYLKGVYDECEKKLPIKQRLGGYVPAQGLTTTKEDVKAFMSLEESTKYSSNLVKLDGDVYKEIPLYFEKPKAKVLTDDLSVTILDGDSNLIDDSNIDNNMIKAVLNYAAQANIYKSLDSSMGSITSFLDTLKENAPKNPDGSNIGTNRRYDKAQNLANQLVWGEKEESPTFWTRLVNILGKITQFVNLGFSPAVYINNLIMGNVANLSEAHGGRNFNKKQLALANKEFFKMIPDYIKNKENSKLYKILTRYDAIQGEFNTELGKGFGSFWNNLKEESFHAFTGSNLGELEIQGTSTIALMMARDLWDKFDENGDPITEIDEREEELFMNTLHELNKSNHGVYNDFDRLYLQPNAFFRLMLQYRKYIVPTYRAKWYGLFGARDQAKRIDMEAGTVEQGYYASMRFFIEDNWRNALKLPTLIENFNNLSDTEKEGVKRSFFDVLYLAAAMILINALLPDEDEGEEAGFLQWWTVLSLRKSFGEVVAYVPFFGIQDQLRTVNSPFVAARTVNNFLKLLAQATGYDFEDGEWKMFEQYDRKYGMYEKGDYKIGARFDKVLPLHNLIEAAYPKELFDNFEKASRMG